MTLATAPAEGNVSTEQGADFHAHTQRWERREAVVTTTHDAPAGNAWEMHRNIGVNYRRAEYMIKVTAGFQMKANSYVKFQFGNAAGMHNPTVSHSAFNGFRQWGDSGEQKKNWVDTDLDADGIYLGFQGGDNQCHFGSYQALELTMMKYYASEIMLEWRWPMFCTANTQMYMTASGVIKGMNITDVDRVMLRAVTGDFQSGNATVEWW